MPLVTQRHCCAVVPTTGVGTAARIAPLGPSAVASGADLTGADAFVLTWPPVSPASMLRRSARSCTFSSSVSSRRSMQQGTKRTKVWRCGGRGGWVKDLKQTSFYLGA
eukprot:352103-Chlamydomonas_euryale.AAC.7